MNVLLDGIQAGNQSGTGTYTSALIRELPEIDPDFNLHVVAPAATLDCLEHAGLASRIPCSDSRSLMATLRRSAELVQHLKRIQPDILHYPANFTRQVGKARSRDTKVVLTVHDLSFLREPRWFPFDRALYYRTMIRMSVSRATRILADSEATSNDLQELLGIDSARIDVIPLGVDEHFKPASPEEIARVKQKYRLPKSFFLFVGTLEPRKNIPCVIEAWDMISFDTTSDLVIAGRDGWKTGPIRKAASNVRQSDRIHFPGFIENGDLPALLSGAEAFIWPSLWEGFGLPPLEAMACGTPVVTSDESSLPEVVADAAITVPPEDVDMIANAMRALLVHEDLRETLRERALKRAAEFTWRRTAELTYDAYGRALESDEGP